MSYRTTIYISDAVMFALRDIAKKEGSNVSKVCRKLLDKGIQEHMQKTQYQDLKQEIKELKELVRGDRVNEKS